MQKQRSHFRQLNHCYRQQSTSRATSVLKPYPFSESAAQSERRSAVGSWALQHPIIPDKTMEKTSIILCRTMTALFLIWAASQAGVRAELVSVNSITNNAKTIGVLFDPPVTPPSATVSTGCLSEMAWVKLQGQRVPARARVTARRLPMAMASPGLRASAALKWASASSSRFWRR